MQDWCSWPGFENGCAVYTCTSVYLGFTWGLLPLFLPAASPVCGHDHESSHQEFSPLYRDSVEPIEKDKQSHAVLIKSLILSYETKIIQFEMFPKHVNLINDLLIMNKQFNSICHCNTPWPIKGHTYHFHWLVKMKDTKGRNVREQGIKLPFIWK